MTIYENGKIYRIEPINGGNIGDVYYGSTTKKLLSQRFAEHKYQYKKFKEGTEKKNKTTSFDLFDKYGLENCWIVLLENVENCHSKNDLIAREAHYIRNNECVNKIIPLRTVKEWTEENKEKIKHYQLQYDKINYEKNKEVIKEKSGQYYKNNKEKINKNKKQHYEENKQQYKEKSKIYNEKHKDELKEKKVIYNQIHKEQTREYQQQYRQLHNEEIKAKKQKKAICECGMQYTHQNKLRHFRTKKHQAFLCNV